MKRATVLHHEYTSEIWGIFSGIAQLARNRIITNVKSFPNKMDELAAFPWHDAVYKNLANRANLDTNTMMDGLQLLLFI